MTLRIGIAGWSVLPPQAEIPGALDELIYEATSSAVKDADMTIADIDGVCMASSDLNDGRAISTMTLTGSTGSFHKSEMRVCNDGLAAVWMGAAEIGSGSAQSLIICAWNKFSDVVDPQAIPALAMEPTMHRALGYDPEAVLELRRSFETGSVTRTSGSPPLEPRDTAAAVIITADGHARAGDRVLTGFGSSTGPYLRPGEAVLAPTLRAVSAALDKAGLSIADIVRVHVGGMHRIDTNELGKALGVTDDIIVREQPQQADLGYAAGLVSLVSALTEGTIGATLVISAGGLGLASANAIIVERT
ncbi:hypothetical protein [Sphingomonas oryzagri]